MVYRTPQDAERRMLRRSARYQANIRLAHTRVSTILCATYVDRSSLFVLLGIHYIIIVTDLGISADEEKETSNQGANEVFHTLLSLIEHTTDRAIVAAVLCLLRKLLATHSGVHTILTFTDEQVTTINLICCRNITYMLSFKSVGARLVKALQILLFDWNWELRESAVGFLAFIFGNEEQVSVLATPCSGINLNLMQASAFSQFGYANNLHNALLQKLEDEEPYVRASALTALAVGSTK